MPYSVWTVDAVQNERTFIIVIAICEKSITGIPKKCGYPFSFSPLLTLGVENVITSIGYFHSSNPTIVGLGETWRPARRNL